MPNTLNAQSDRLFKFYAKDAEILVAAESPSAAVEKMNGMNLEISGLEELYDGHDLNAFFEPFSMTEPKPPLNAERIFLWEGRRMSIITKSAAMSLLDSGDAYVINPYSIARYR
jgi:hypothetical protein